MPTQRVTISYHTTTKHYLNNTSHNKAPLHHGNTRSHLTLPGHDNTRRFCTGPPLRFLRTWLNYTNTAPHSIGRNHTLPKHSRASHHLDWMRQCISSRYDTNAIHFIASPHHATTQHNHTSPYWTWTWQYKTLLYLTTTELFPTWLS